MPIQLLSIKKKKSPSLLQLQDALKPFGVIVYDNPKSSPDEIGFIFSSETLVESQLKRISEEY